MSPSASSKQADEPQATPIKELKTRTLATNRAFAFQLPGSAKGKGKDATPRKKAALLAIGTFSPFGALEPPAGPSKLRSPVVPARGNSVSSRLTTPGPSSGAVVELSSLQRISDTFGSAADHKPSFSDSARGKRKWEPLGKGLGDEVLRNTRVDSVAAEVKEEDAGIGVSPRKLRKWKRGPMPPSKRLEDLLSSQKTSVGLFYASLAQQLHPKIPSKRKRDSFLGDRDDRGAHVATKQVRPINHVRTAPVRLRLEEALHAGGQGAGKMFRAKVLRINPSNRDDIQFRSLPDGTEETADVEAGDPTGHTEAAEALVILGSPPTNISVPGWDVREVHRRLSQGADPQGLGGGGQAFSSQPRIWEVGVWEPWSEVEVAITDDPGPQDETALEEADSQTTKRQDSDGGDQDTDPRDGALASDGPTRRMRVYFASRYLIALDE